MTNCCCQTMSCFWCSLTNCFLYSLTNCRKKNSLNMNRWLKKTMNLLAFCS